MVSPVTAADLSRFKTQRVGDGTFGAKTTELDKFKARCDTLGKDRLERAGLIIPPYVSLSIDLFMPALMRMGVCNQHGEFVPNPSSAIDIEDGVTGILEREHPEARDIIEAAAQFTGHPIAIRSDERSAKGIGAFKTFMNSYFGNAPGVDGYENDQYKLLDRILDSLYLQFDPVPMAFKEKVGMPHGIGIMIMPLVGDIVHRRKEDMLYPKVSLSGFTAIEQDKIIVNFGYGLGGGVDQNAGTYIGNKEQKISGGVNCQENLTMFDLEKHYTNTIGGNIESLFMMSLVPHETEIYDAAIRVGNRMLEIAKELGNDFYWEIQSIDFEADKWAITQISEHVWPKIEKPAGKELLTIGEGNFGIIIGSGIVSCKGITRGATLPGGWSTRDINEFTSGVHKNALLISPRIAKSDIMSVGILMVLNTFPLYCNAGAIINCDQDHGRPLRAHISGIYREAGIPILTPNTGARALEEHAVPFAEVFSAIQGKGLTGREMGKELTRIRNELLRTKEFIVWADELNQTGGVVAP